ncbi:MAG: glycosyltransferase family 4 protein [Verrucomicrobiia bacterium]
MRLLFVHERFGALGGAESNACITASELSQRGHVVGLAHGSGTGKDEAGWAKIFQTRFPLASGATGKIIEAALKEFSPDVVYVHKMADLELIGALVDSKKPLVRMVHDHDIYCMRSYKYFYWSRRICTRPLTPYCVFPCGAFVARDRQGRLPVRYVSYSDKKREVQLNQRFHRLVVVSHYMKEELLRNGFDPRRIEIHPPVPRMGDCTLRSSFSERNLILFAGQIIRGKGVDVLLRALARVQVPFECVILGEGSHRRACERLSAKLGLTGRVTFKGFVPQAELKEYYRNCSVMALSSVWPEPIATIGLEAMRYALPVVAFDAGGVRDWLLDGQNGFLVPWMDVDAFANRLGRLLLDKKLAKKMGECGFAMAVERFGFDAYISGLERVFQQVLEETKSA